jgi:hypothetical protein
MKIDLEGQHVIAIAVGALLILAAIYWKFAPLVFVGIFFISIGLGSFDLD